MALKPHRQMKKLECADDGRSKVAKKSDQIGFYSGDIRAILERAKSLVRIYLATVDLFPTPEEAKNVVDSVYDESCGDIMSRRRKGKPQLFPLQSNMCLVLITGVSS